MDLAKALFVPEHLYVFVRIFKCFSGEREQKSTVG